MNRFVEAGETVSAPSLDIQIGKCVIAEDLCDKQLVSLATSKGKQLTANDYNVNENKPTEISLNSMRIPIYFVRNYVHFYKIR